MDYGLLTMVYSKISPVKKIIRTFAGNKTALYL
ncbi:MAG: hypothetical protein RLZZ429_548 [Bacteroidota bacterium]|jgi:hypothetical protein